MKLGSKEELKERKAFRLEMKKRFAIRRKNLNKLIKESKADFRAFKARWKKVEKSKRRASRKKPAYNPNAIGIGRLDRPW